MKKITFPSRLAAIDWIADHVEDKGQFEVLREQLNFNYIYTGVFFLDLGEKMAEVVWLNEKD